MLVFYYVFHVMLIVNANLLSLLNLNKFYVRSTTKFQKTFAGKCIRIIKKKKSIIMLSEYFLR